jgi:hypothetical protein
MRTPLLILLAGIAAAAIAQHSNPPADTQELDKDAQIRIRAERTTEPARREPRDEALKSGDASRDDRRP